MEASHRHVAFEMSFATHFIGAAANGRKSINKSKIVVLPPNPRAVLCNKNGKARLLVVSSAVSRLGAPDLGRSVPSVEMESSSAPVERMCAVLARPNGLVCELKRSYKSLEANRKGQRRITMKRSELRTLSLTSNQPMERTPPRCALRRRSSAR